MKGRYLGVLDLVLAGRPFFLMYVGDDDVFVEGHFDFYICDDHCRLTSFRLYVLCFIVCIYVVNGCFCSCASFTMKLVLLATSPF